MKNLTYGYAITGSFCTFDKSIEQIKNILSNGINVIPIMSLNAYSTDTRFGTAKSFIEKIENLTGKKIISTLTGAEPIGPKKMCDLLIVSPCTGNTLAKLANGVYDTPVTLAVKSHLRNKRPVLIGVSSNDSLSSSAKNIGQLLNYKHYYFIPMKQDDSVNKPFSVVRDFTKTLEAGECALRAEQMQPILT